MRKKQTGLALAYAACSDWEGLVGGAATWLWELNPQHKEMKPSWGTYRKEPGNRQPVSTSRHVFLLVSSDRKL